MPKVYSTDHSTSVLQTHSWRTLSNSALYLLPYIQPDLQILDVGCGPGSMTIDFAKHVPRGHVTGVEYVPDPLEGDGSVACQALEISPMFRSLYTMPTTVFQVLKQYKSRRKSLMHAEHCTPLERLEGLPREWKHPSTTSFCLLQASDSGWLLSSSALCISETSFKNPLYPESPSN